MKLPPTPSSPSANKIIPTPYHPQHQPNTNSHYFFWYSCSIVITVKLAIDMHITIFLYQTAVTNIFKKEELY